MLNAETLKSDVTFLSLSIPFSIRNIEKCIRMYEQISIGRHIFFPPHQIVRRLFFHLWTTKRKEEEYKPSENSLFF